MPTPYKVVVADNHSTLRQALCAMIDGEPDLSVCWQGDRNDELIQALRDQEPDLLIVDFSASIPSTLEWIADLTRRFPNIPVLVFSTSEEGWYAKALLRAGAKGYVMKDDPPGDLLKAVRQVLEGLVSLSSTRRGSSAFSDGGPSLQW